MAIDPSAVQGFGEDAAAQPDAALAASEEAAAAPQPDIWAALENVDPDEVLTRYPALKRKFDGLVGTHAQQQAQRLAQQQIEAQRSGLLAEAQATAIRAAEDERLKHLHDEDLFTWDQERQKVEAGRVQQEQQRMVQQAPVIAAMRNQVEYDQQVLAPLFYQMTPEAQQRLSGKQYPGNGYESRRLALEDITREIGEARVKDAQHKWETAHAAEIAAIREAARKDALSEANGDQTIDTGSGMSAEGVPSPDEWMAMTFAQRSARTKMNPNIVAQIEMAATMRGEGQSLGVR